MEKGCYAIEQHQNHWVVSVCGARVLTCKTKRTALKAARRAMVLLRQSQQVELFGQAPSYFHRDGLHRAGSDFQRDRAERGHAPAQVAATRRG